jgi:hypothetical protein
MWLADKNAGLCYCRVQARILCLLMIESLLVIAVFKPVPFFSRTFLLSAYLILKVYYFSFRSYKKEWQQ